MSIFNTKGKFSKTLQSALMFAARYSHNRQTAASHEVITALKQAWPFLDDFTKRQLISESTEAEYRQRDWEMFREWADEQQQQTR